MSGGEDVLFLARLGGHRQASQSHGGR